MCGKRALFICSMGRMRSKTAAHCTKDLFLSTDYAGTDPDADVVVTQQQIDYCDVIFFMDSEHLYDTCGLWRRDLRDKEFHILGVPDEFYYMEDELVYTLRARLVKYTGN